MKCYLCGNENISKRNGKVRDNNEIDILECEECGLVFLSKFCTNEKFYIDNKMNDLSFFQHSKRIDFQNNGKQTLLNNYIETLSKDKEEAIKFRLKFVKEQIIAKNILDFGSGRAEFLILAKEYAKTVSGVEIEQQVEKIYENNNIKLYRDLDDINLIEGEGYDIITAFHVIEHLHDPIGILKRLSFKLKDNGKIIIEVPNANDALLTIFQNKSYQNFIYWSPHLYYFNTHTLSMIAKKAGLHVDFIKCIQRYSISNNLYWLANGLPAGQKHWGKFIDNPILQNAYEQTLASLGATDTLIAQFSKI
ncbi:class I SAM-dependent methyltransferase [Campylobacter sp. RKI_CA19_01121]|uniref:class I SAM-dependent methyltransferase n=1 Tax=Campylobacter sp. RKI_CA19_01121 TaxID=2911626 RepID=UPI0021E93DE8|nr:class I SAM-dependent methyltransferase [Campylobacter sp. RKI_CA19_01121]MCV3336558.1 class I SAM-dependent methyltransferase [Campylobacter sp. RKI_CA19_01121]